VSWTGIEFKKVFLEIAKTKAGKHVRVMSLDENGDGVSRFLGEYQWGAPPRSILQFELSRDDIDELIFALKEAKRRLPRKKK